MVPVVVLWALFMRCAIAQSVTSLFLPMVEPQTLVGSVIGSNHSTTTYSIACPPGTDAEKCGVDGAMTAIEGPQTAMYNIIDAADDISAYISCDLADSATVSCTSTISGSGAGQYTGTSTTTITAASTMFLPVTITAAASTGATVLESTASQTAATRSSVSNTNGVGRTTSDDPCAVGSFAAALALVILGL
ncbi:hypothetical protein UA08_06335 [Talaromyces atroroseus]|uniref:GPI anchored protein n=1 Tax=Talaromyces atroroseus TaxID=1441469 RepID=A0A225AMM7_TALAT|nr:hypothetical protein UA08_06335 [Talaromyces atroroseus]OKL58518.1 hypothetical protein UA08_06335 [Talaromyces atroroseus]